MKKFYGVLFVFLSLLAPALKLQAQTPCSDISFEIYGPNPQTGQYNYFGVRVSLQQPYDRDITVSGYIYDEGSPNQNHPYTLTIPAGSLSAETGPTFYQTSPATTAAASIGTVTPCPCITELATAIAYHQSFHELNVLFDLALNMPTPNQFIASFDENTAQQQGDNLDNYLSQISGMPIGQIQAINQGIINHISSLKDAFPELQQISEQDVRAVFTQAANIYSDNNPGAGLNKRLWKNKGTFDSEASFARFLDWKNVSKETDYIGYMPTVKVVNAVHKTVGTLNPCAHCKRVGRVRMINYTVFGAFTCTPGGWRAVWGCAVLGFWLAAEEALACIQQNCPQQ